MSSDIYVYPESLFLPQRMLCDCCSLAVEFNFEGQPIKLYRNSLDSPWSEALHTGARWQSVAGHVLSAKPAPFMRIVQNAYGFGNGLAFDDK